MLVSVVVAATLLLGTSTASFANYVHCIHGLNIYSIDNNPILVDSCNKTISPKQLLYPPIVHFDRAKPNDTYSLMLLKVNNATTNNFTVNWIVGNITAQGTKLNIQRGIPLSYTAYTPPANQSQYGFYLFNTTGYPHFGSFKLSSLEVKQFFPSRFLSQHGIHNDVPTAITLFNTFNKTTGGQHFTGTRSPQQPYPPTYPDQQHHPPPQQPTYPPPPYNPVHAPQYPSHPQAPYPPNKLPSYSNHFPQPTTTHRPLGLTAPTKYVINTTTFVRPQPHVRPAFPLIIDSVVFAGSGKLKLTSVLLINGSRYSWPNQTWRQAPGRPINLNYTMYVPSMDPTPIPKAGSSASTLSTTPVLFLSLFVILILPHKFICLS